MTNKIIINSNEQITCPHCEAQFSLKDAIAYQLIEQHEDEYKKMVQHELKSIRDIAAKDAEKQHSKAFQKTILELKEQLNDSKESAQRFKNQITAEKEKTELRVRESMALETQSLQESLDDKNAQLAQFRTQELALRKEKQALEDKEKSLELELVRRVSIEKQSLQATIEDQFKQKEAELRKKIADASKANDELKRKLDQGSQQLQGEVLELELESELVNSYPLDDIEPVKKGARGADIIQIVRLRSGTICGKIVWETKRAENWSNTWISKLKADMQEVGGEIGVLVSSVFPAGIKEPMLLQDGAWLVKPNLAKGLSEALRTVLIETQRQKTVNVGKNEQMEALYDYICSTQFVHRIKAVVDHQEQMQIELTKEKSAMQRIWKKREIQIEGITTQMMSVCGELQGISKGGIPMLDDIAILG
jgi:hypothetical protein